MTETYLSVGDIAQLLGVQSSSISGYLRKNMLPEPDVVIGLSDRPTKGWKRETILQWNTNRPGSGNRTPRK